MSAAIHATGGHWEYAKGHTRCTYSGSPMPILPLTDECDIGSPEEHASFPTSCQAPSSPSMSRISTAAPAIDCVPRLRRAPFYSDVMRPLPSIWPTLERWSAATTPSSLPPAHPRPARQLRQRSAPRSFGRTRSSQPTPRSHHGHVSSHRRVRGACSPYTHTCPLSNTPRTARRLLVWRRITRRAES